MRSLKVMGGIATGVLLMHLTSKVRRRCRRSAPPNPEPMTVGDAVRELMIELGKHNHPSSRRPDAKEPPAEAGGSLPKPRD